MHESDERLALQPHTRASLLLRLKDRDDESAWEEFAAIYQPILYRMARSRGHQDADAREIVQEVMVAITRHIEKFQSQKEHGSFRAWLSTIVRTKAINHFVRQSDQRSVGGTAFAQRLEQHVDPRCNAEQSFEQEFRKQMFLWAADKVRDTVSESTWQAFWLSCVQDFSVNEVASRLKLSVGSVYVARTRVIAKMRRTIEAYQRLDEGAGS